MKSKISNLAKFRELIVGQPKETVDAMAMAVAKPAGGTWPQMNAAFEYFGLDPQHPSHRDLLLWIFASATFDSKSAGGAPRVDLEEETMLGLQSLFLRGQNPGISDLEAADRIKARGASTTAGTIRQRLPQARRTAEWALQGLRLFKARKSR